LDKIISTEIADSADTAISTLKGMNFLNILCKISSPRKDIGNILTVADSRRAFNDEQPYLAMSAPHDSAANGDGGMLKGHGIAVALVAIFVGMAMVVAFAASDGAIFGLNSSSPAGSTAPVIDSGADGAEVLSRDTFEDSGTESASQSGADKSAGSAPPEQDATLSPEERRLLTMRNFSWDLIAVQYFANSQDIMEKFEQQNFTRQKPAQPEAEPLDLSDRVSVDVDRDIDREDRVIDIDTPIDTPATNEEEQPEEEEEQQDEEPEQEEPQEVEEDNSDSGSGSDDDQSGDFGSGSNSTDTNSTSIEDSGSGSDSSGDDSGIEASISIG
jgi:hypothetical protein